MPNVEVLGPSRPAGAAPEKDVRTTSTRQSNDSKGSKEDGGRNRDREDSHVSYSSERSNCVSMTSAQRAQECQDGPVERKEIVAWYVYDWANSPFYQVLDILSKVLLKRLAERSQASGGSFPSQVLSAGSYPAFVMWLTAGVQLIALLSFSAFGDYGVRRRQLLRIGTYVSCGFIVLFIACFDGAMWWLAGLLRICAGVFFILCGVYYNAFLPLLAAGRKELQGLEGRERAEREVQLSDEMSAMGFFTGYCGGTCMQIVAYVVLRLAECDASATSCSDFSRLFWLAFCIALVGIWWFGFSAFTFRHLKPRAGPPYPEGASIYTLGWVQAYETCKFLVNYRQTLLFIFAYFIWSDALATTQNVAVLILDDEAGKDSSVVLNSALATIAGLVGVLVVLKVQQGLKLANKTMLMWQLVIFAIITCAGGFGLVTAIKPYGFYLCLGPVVLMMGSLQANQRSLYSSLAPVGREAAMFSFYAITDKGSSLIGTGVIGVVHTSSGSYVGTFWYCVLAFALSAVILFFVDVEKGLVDAGKSEALAREEPPKGDADEQGTPPKEVAV